MRYVEKFFQSFLIPVLVVAGIVSLVQSNGAAADEVAFFKGKTIRIVVSSSTGSFDAYARLIAPSLGRQLGATVIVQIKPGAGGIAALNDLYVALPDGLQLGLLNGTAMIQAQLLQQPNVRYDMAKMGYLGIVSVSPKLWYVRPDLPFKTAKELVAANMKIRWASAGPTTNFATGAAIVCEALKLNCQIINGYDGTGPSMLALNRREVDAIYFSDESGILQVHDGNIVPVATMSRERSSLFPDVPTIFESLQLTADQKWWFSFRDDSDQLGRVLIAPPNMPDSRLQLLQDTVKQILTDPKIIEEGEKTGRQVSYEDAKTTQQRVTNILTSITPEEQIRVRKVILNAQ